MHISTWVWVPLQEADIHDGGGVTGRDDGPRCRFNCLATLIRKMGESVPAGVQARDLRDNMEGPW